MKNKTKENKKEKPVLFVATKAVIYHNGKILILRESGKYNEGTNASRYDLPGGRMNPGERFDKVLEREVFEETGLKVEINDPIMVNEWRPIVHNKQWQIVGIFFKCRAKSKKVKLGIDHDAYEWINPLEYRKYNIIDNLKPLFKNYLNKKEVK